jgi:ribose transport system substrate-binding protein
MMRRLIAGIAVASLAVVVWGCGQEEKQGGPKAGKKLTFAVIPKANVFTFWPTVKKGAEAAGKELGIEIIWRGAKDEISFSEQIEIVKAMITKRVDGIALAPQSATALVDVAKEAAAAGIPVAIIDSGLNWDGSVSFVATDNYQGGVMGAQRLAKLLPEGGQVALIRNIRGSASTEAREQGFLDTINNKHKNLKLVAEQYAEGDPTKGQQVVAAILAANQELAGVFTANEPGAIGALNAVRNANRVGKVKIVGFDASPTLIAGIRDGSLDSTIVQDPYQMGYQGVKAIYDHLQGKQVPKERKTPIKLIMKENLDTPEIEEYLAAYGAVVKTE